MSVYSDFYEHIGHPKVDPCIVHHFGDHEYARQMTIPAGCKALSHAHTYSHLSILATGKVVVERDDSKPTEYTAPACILIPAGVHHAITALETAVWFCVHGTDFKDPEKIDEVLIGKGE